MKLFRTISLLTTLLLVSVLLISCQRKIKPKEGQMEILCSIYLNASQGLEESHTFSLSKLYFNQYGMLEQSFSPFEEGGEPRLGEVRKGFYAPLYSGYRGDSLYVERRDRPFRLGDKEFGAPFPRSLPPNFIKYQKVSDTLLFRKKYQRIEIHSPKSYSRYYLYKSDTILPYSLNPAIEKKLGARVERIESYDPKTDRLVTMQLFRRSNIEKELPELMEAYLERSFN